MQTRVDDLLLQIAGRQHGLCTRLDLTTIGLRPSSIQRRLDRGSLVLVRRGVYLVPAMAGPLTELQLAALLVPSGALSRRTAARLHGLRVPPSKQIDVVAPLEAHRPRLPSLQLHRTAHLPAVDITQIEGMATTTVARTLCDLAADLRPTRLQFVGERALLDQQCSIDDLAACRSAFVRRGRRGSASLNEFVDSLLERDGPDATALEQLVRGILTRFAVQGFIEQYQPDWYDGIRGIVDFAHPGAQIIIEADSRRWHATTQAMADDRRRDRLAQRNGWIVLRFTWHELEQRPGAVADEIIALIEARSSSSSAA